MSLGTASHKARFQDDQTTAERERETTNLLLFVAHDDKIGFFFFFKRTSSLMTTGLLHQKGALLLGVALFAFACALLSVLFSRQIKECRSRGYLSGMTSPTLLIKLKAEAALLISWWSCSDRGARRSKELPKSLRACVGRLEAQRVFFPYLKCHPSSCVTPPWGRSETTRVVQ